MKSPFLILLLAVVFAGCSQDESSKKSDKNTKAEKKAEKSIGKDLTLVCLDEGDKVTCKLVTKRVNKDREVEFEWKSPDGKDDREREMVLPANHASIFDVRHKKGRVKGVWTVEVELDDEEAATTFRVQ